jgi:hypothetical protein
MQSRHVEWQLQTIHDAELTTWENGQVVIEKVKTWFCAIAACNNYLFWCSVYRVCCSVKLLKIDKESLGADLCL